MSDHVLPPNGNHQGVGHSCDRGSPQGTAILHWPAEQMVEAHHSMQPTWKRTRLMATCRPRHVPCARNERVLGIVTSIDPQCVCSHKLDPAPSSICLMALTRSPLKSSLTRPCTAHPPCIRPQILPFRSARAPPTGSARHATPPVTPPSASGSHDGRCREEEEEGEEEGFPPPSG